MDRRELLGALGGLAISGVPTLSSLPAQQARQFPRKADFAIPEGRTYLNCAYTHPLSVQSRPCDVI